MSISTRIDRALVVFQEKSISCLGLLQAKIFIKNWNMNFSKERLAKLSNYCEQMIKNVLLFMVALYRTAGSQHLGGQCRFEPSCSQYAIDSLKTHRPLKAITLIIHRISRCHPFGSSGWDPVPPKKGIN